MILNRKLLNKTIHGCFECPIFVRDELKCGYNHMSIHPDIVSEGKLPDDCVLPLAPRIKLLQIYRCKDCFYCKNDCYSEVITTYPPIYVDKYVCNNTGKRILCDVERVIADDCPLKDDEEV